MSRLRLELLTSTTDAKKGQAVVETIFLLPILMSFIFLVLQSFYMIHRVQIAQKNLKQMVLGSAGNRFDFSRVVFKSKSGTTKGSPKSLHYTIDDPAGSKKIAFRFSIPPYLRWVIPGDRKAVFDALEKDGHAGLQSMGLCTGGYYTLAQGIKLSPEILDNNKSLCSQ